ncbi:helix-hairpin-helix domain-containing protein [Gloeobacter violaceus]|uniref:Glr3151 protein n=1 Tax=Gloeobacter violaceus (strain ATCC 29082 / PCC 7421) TaxID=251221 RepID=Q7NGL8_GLOVI|nr:helix-hairpin-helix domain-containing protein [Gloeobacter violaceus]BAC91092.1 glr3151 [Gloeobacter violaceus PCC 7421]
MDSARNWRWLLAVPIVNWLGLMLAGQEVRKPSWVRWAVVYAILSSLGVIAGTVAGEWFLFWTVWGLVAAHTFQVQSEYQNRLLLMQDSQQRLQSDQDMRLARELGMGIDINRCSIDDLLRLPGLSIIEARRIVEARRSGGPYLSADELIERADLSSIKVRRLEPLLQFCYYEPPVALPVTLDVNEASVVQLEQLEGLDTHLAVRIVREREQHGDYPSLGDLRDRLNLTPKVVARLLNRLTF